MTRATGGIVWINISIFIGVLADIMIRYLVDYDFHTSQLVFFRSFTALLIIFPIIYFKFGIRKTLETDKKRHYMSVAFFMLVSIFSFYEGMKYIPLPQLIALTLIVTPLSMFFAVIFLKESCQLYKILGFIIGLFGVLLIIRPGVVEVNPFIAYPFISSFFWALVVILLKGLSNNQHSMQIVIYPLLFMLPITLPFALIDWKWPEGSHIYFILGHGIFIVMHLLAKIKAYSMADITTLAPFDFVGFVFASIFAYFLFDELVDIWMVLGSFIIVMSGWYIVIREKNKHIPEEFDTPR